MKRLCLFTLGMICAAPVLSPVLAKDVAPALAQCSTFEVYRDASGAWRWVRKSNTPTCQSSKPYETRAAAELSARKEMGVCDRIVLIEP